MKYDCTSAEYATLASFEGLGLGDRRGEKSCFAIKKGKYMKRFLLILLLCVPFVCNAQTEEKKYYIYSIVSFEGEFTKENFKVYFDDGKEVKRLRNDNDNKMRFTTPAGALMYFLSQGWEMYLNGSTVQGDSGISTTSSYWILRKPCSKEEFENAVKAATKK